MEQKITPKDYFNKVLQGTASGIVIGVIPNAILGNILGLFPEHPILTGLIQAGLVFQIATPLIIGTMIAKQFNFDNMTALATAAGTAMGAGNIRYDEELGTFTAGGLGDVISVMVTAAIIVGMFLLIGNKFGSAKVIGIPLTGAVGGVVGLFLFPYISKLTGFIGGIIASMTNFQPMVMSILIAVLFSIFVISPITTIGLGVAIQLNGIAAGAASMGIAATMLVLVVNSWKINDSGITIAVGLGGMKIYMANLFRKPIMLLPIVTTAIISSITVPIVNITGTPDSSGLGLGGLVGPLASIDGGQGILSAFITWIIIPLVVGILASYFFEKVLKLYDRKDVFGIESE